MQCDSGPGSLHRTDSLPEIQRRVLDCQFWVSIPWNDGQDRLDAEFANEILKKSPSFGRHGRAEVVEAKEILRGVRNHV